MAVTVRCVMLLFSLHLFTVGEAHVIINPLTLPCPDPQSILPCVCTVLPDFSMDMNCSDVESGDDLARVFSLEFPFAEFNKLTINKNKNLKALRGGDLGPTNYKEIHITNGALETIVMTALSGSYSTLTSLNVGHNSLLSFPFQEIHSFRYLERLDIQDNLLKDFPDMSSPTLQVLQMRDNPLEHITFESLQNLPQLREIGLQNCGLRAIPSGTFTHLSYLESVHLEGNKLTTLAADTVDLTTDTNYVHLNENNITSVHVDALRGVRGDVWIQGNQLKELKEEVWRPLLPDIILNAARNPLICGCEIAWLIFDGNYMSHVKEDATCSDGELLHQLDPAIYSQCP
ncbi:oplophorus-luciferin 2-monooxygenase non-catalytic subunit-like [Panulirus ornatus]|uniref:oplophorus-luciferin 2-monooxygenase non-catalytic subunit-like n=1 Tax=Panulirus ornatus TaxID=150431 RepID=UPI003A894B7A